MLWAPVPFRAVLAAWRSVGRPFPACVASAYARRQRSLMALHTVAHTCLPAIRLAQARPGA